MNIINKKIELDFQKKLALEFVKGYCAQKNYSLTKLSCLDFLLLYNECAFFHYGENEQKGLINDMETLPQVILSIRYEDGKLEIEETKYTKDYFSK